MSGGTISKEGLAALIELRDRTDDVACAFDGGNRSLSGCQYLGAI